MSDLFLLTAAVDGEGEAPVLLAATVEEAQAAAGRDDDTWTDEYLIYLAVPGKRPRQIWSCWVSHGEATRTLGVWRAVA